MSVLCHTLFSFFKDLRSLYKPYTAFSFFFFPCAINMYGIIKFNNSDYHINKSVTDANAYMKRTAQEK
ncbi:hypothetical protein PFAG_01980 [Plasmodium falciparum Santa Lucia]|uniref:Uncharacterized protein n=7 Tax=Plasmodium falciparum TaxID=5833 RepID=A0A5K1K8Z8_PLAF7|nr:conserved Plasmodium protein, unknown function [Plasmodium falciparum 3D7]ETW19003.1 hypothetical protein PFFVO_02022 [Plasmodium falciparum Vietnam Oak-Knoll (FVO)]ETW37168.1 hypothetical protein PFTANZ_02100 [Plasmodium falciparum Tanzania (2000708)]ETW43232.1 hypothetical protein PFNF135_02147 [Plasmodium falciparum NF135/5.C10]ETW45644.1 hypothetical protein PFMALIP_06298 [Plasmodium falciparum MaliPS096_E11]EUT87154.1 hypothetical protein PFAG_01980 [Plasmodium falciparum Santa Lucia]